MSTGINGLIDQYLTWLKDKTLVRQIGDYSEITTPYLDRHNDYLQIYARKKDDSFILSDDGYILNDLEMSGCKIDTPKREQLLKLTLNGLGVKKEGNELQVVATPDNFALKKHNLLQAMLAVNDMFYLSAPLIASIFYEDVVTWLDIHQIRYTPRIKFTGRSGYDHNFDFVIPKSNVQPERIIQTINRPSKDTATLLAFAWFDTKEVRAENSRAYAILNDQERAVTVEIIEALKNYEVNPVVWSNRDSMLSELAA